MSSDREIGRQKTGLVLTRAGSSIVVPVWRKALVSLPEGCALLGNADGRWEGPTPLYHLTIEHLLWLACS